MAEARLQNCLQQQTRLHGLDLVVEAAFQLQTRDSRIYYQSQLNPLYLVIAALDHMLTVEQLVLTF